MSTANVSGSNSTAQFYGSGPHRSLSQTLLGGGSGKALTLPAVSQTAGAVQPCASEVISVAYTTTGSYVLTFAGNHIAIAHWSVAVDDINGSTPVQGYLGQFSNLGTATPMTCVLTTYAAGSAADVAAATPVRVHIWFKDDITGAAA